MNWRGMPNLPAPTVFVVTCLATLAGSSVLPTQARGQEIGTSILPPAEQAAEHVEGEQAAPAMKSPAHEGSGPDGAGNAMQEPSQAGVETDTAPTSGPTPAPAPDAAAFPEPETGARPLPEPEPGDPGTAVAAGVSDPLFHLRGLWRMAVQAGETELSFTAWAEAWLAEDPARRMGGASRDPAPEPGAAQAERTRATSERWLARSGPVTMGEAGRVVTIFGSAIPTAFCSPFYVCYIELEPGEVLTDPPSWGDTIRWQLVTKQHGPDRQNISIEVKPSLDAENTNLVIPTDRRLYTINLVNDRHVHTPILSFHYPDSAARAMAVRIEADRARDAQRKAALEAARAGTLERTGLPTSTGARPASELDFGFRVTGNARFRPVRVYTDGARTFIDLHPEYRGDLPTVLPGPDEANKALNTRVTGNGTRLEADRVITDVYLQAGKQRVRIRKTGS